MNNADQLLKLLVIDDDEDDYFIINEYLKPVSDRNKIQIDWCYKYNEGLQKIRENEYSIYLIDYRLGAKTGIDLIETAVNEGCERPLILLTGRGNPEIDQKAMQVGATDYLVKGELNTEKLERCIRYSLERSSNIKALKANENKFRSIFERSSDAIFLCKPDGTITQINQAGNILLGCEGADIVGCSVFDLIESREHANKLKKDINDRLDIDDEEVTLLTKEREKRFYLLSLSREEDLDQLEHLQGILHDITERKQQENNTLQIQKLNAAGRLMITLAHEVRNPLNNINLSAEQLITATEEERRIYIDIIQRNSKRINALITELLHSLRSEMNFQKIVLQDLINELLLIAEDSAQLKGISLTCSMPEKNIFINADKEKMKIAIFNLINNAIEAVEKNTGKIAIKVVAEENKYVLKVIDNGCGMNEEQISRLFEPYYTTKRNGMGLGMVATLSILQAHNATISVDSTIDSGTTFTIEFKNI